MVNKKKPIIEPKKETYPIRINKYLSHKGIATRAGVDEMIKNKKILINGRTAKLGDKILEKDQIDILNNHSKKKYIYFAYNKPIGVVTTNPQKKETSILQKIKITERVFPVGRLDKDSSGLIILTNDGRITDRLLNPNHNHEKEYIVEVDRKFTPAFKKHMENGVEIDGTTTKPIKFEKISEKLFKIILTEGKNRQIRRMTEKLGYTVRKLNRVRIQNISIGNLKTNAYREIKGEELQEFLKSINL